MIICAIPKDFRGRSVVMERRPFKAQRALIRNGYFYCRSSRFWSGRVFFFCSSISSRIAKSNLVFLSAVLPLWMRCSESPCRSSLEWWKSMETGSFETPSWYESFPAFRTECIRKQVRIFLLRTQTLRTRYRPEFMGRLFEARKNGNSNGFFFTCTLHIFSIPSKFHFQTAKKTTRVLHPLWIAKQAVWLCLISIHWIVFFWSRFPRKCGFDRWKCGALFS